jgi:hypothetical protein
MTRNLTMALLLVGTVGLTAWTILDWAQYSAFNISLLWR